MVLSSQGEDMLAVSVVVSSLQRPTMVLPSQGEDMLAVSVVAVLLTETHHGSLLTGGGHVGR